MRPFPGVDKARWPISPDASEDPRWSADGAWLFYRSGGRIVRVPVAAKGPFSAGPPQIVADVQVPPTGQSPAAFVVRRRSYDVAPDSRVLVLQEDGFAARDRAPREIVVVADWVSQLSRR